MHFKYSTLNIKIYIIILSLLHMLIWHVIRDNLNFREGQSARTYSSHLVDPPEPTIKPGIWPKPVSDHNSRIRTRVRWHAVPSGFLPRSDLWEKTGIRPLRKNQDPAFEKKPDPTFEKKPGSDHREKKTGSDLREKTWIRPSRKPGSDLREKTGSDLRKKPGADLREKTGSDLREKTGSRTFPIFTYHHYVY